MSGTKPDNQYRSTESKFKGGAREMYVTYELPQRTRGSHTSHYPKIRRVYVAGEVTDWTTGVVRKRTGREVCGVRIDYERSREGYQRRGYRTHRGDTAHDVREAEVKATDQQFTKIVELPPHARKVRFYASQADLPPRYQTALQSVR